MSRRYEQFCGKRFLPPVDIKGSRKLHYYHYTSVTKAFYKPALIDCTVEGGVLLYEADQQGIKTAQYTLLQCEGSRASDLARRKTKNKVLEHAGSFRASSTCTRTARLSYRRAHP